MDFSWKEKLKISVRARIATGPQYLLVLVLVWSCLGSGVIMEVLLPSTGSRRSLWAHCGSLCNRLSKGYFSMAMYFSQECYSGNICIAGGRKVYGNFSLQLKGTVIIA